MRNKAILLAVLTTVLWSGSYILNKLAFQDGLGPLTLSGTRYVLAGLLLMAVMGARRRFGARGVTPDAAAAAQTGAQTAAAGAPAQSGAAATAHPAQASAPSEAAPATARRLPVGTILLLGLLGYTIAQGMQYMGQAHLTPTQSSLCLSVGNTAMVMLLDLLWLRENQTRLDWLKLLLLVGGITLYYNPFGGEGVSLVGIGLMALSSVGYAAQMTLNRRLLTTRKLAPMTLVAWPMLVGGAALLAAGLLTEGTPRFTLRTALMLLYLSGVSGALGFFLWTKSQKALTAFESSGINNLMLIEIALLDFLFFGRRFSPVQLLAIALVFGTIVWIQAGKRPHAKGAAVR